MAIRIMIGLSMARISPYGCAYPAASPWTAVCKPCAQHQFPGRSSMGGIRSNDMVLRMGALIGGRLGLAGGPAARPGPPQNSEAPG
jgi:hypothetical protein